MHSKTIIGYLILQKDLQGQQEITERVSSDFFINSDRQVYEMIKNANKQGLYANYKYLENKGVGLDRLVLYVSRSTSGSSQEAKSEFETALRELITEYDQRLVREIQFCKSVEEIDKRRKKRDEIVSRLIPKQVESIDEILATSLMEKATNPIDVTKLDKFGIPNIDNNFFGFMKGDLVTIGGYMSSGKSTYMLTAIKHLSQNRKVFVYSGEMPKASLAGRLLSMSTGLDFVTCIEMGSEKVENKIKALGLQDRRDRGLNEILKIKNNLKIADQALNFEELVAQIRAIHDKDGLDFVFIDYIQLVKLANPVSQQERINIGYMVNNLKQLAKELNIVIIQLAQLGRGAMSREEPETYDIKESNDIESASDYIFLLWTKEKEGQKVTSLKLAKDRNFSKFARVQLDYNITTKSYA